MGALISSRRAVAAALTVASIASVVPAQTPAAAANPANPAVRLDAAKRRAVIDTLAARLRRHYVDADTGALIADRVRARLMAGAYDTITSPARFAEAVTVDLRSVNDDRHLNVTYNPENRGLRPGPEGIRMGQLPRTLPPVGPPPTGPGGDAQRRSN